VITHEIELCNNEIAKYSSKKRVPPEELNERLQSFMISKQTLEIAVSTGGLSLEQYSQKLSVAMGIDLKLASYLKKNNRKMEAARVFQRVKIMRKELQGGG